MATTIRINDETKDRLDKIRARLILQDQKYTQEELLEFIIKLAEANPLLMSKDSYSPPTPEEKKKFFSLKFKGNQSDKTLDEELYS